MTVHLESTKLLDLSRALAGPLCSMMLGDLGMKVIKVERPNLGDESRAWGPPFDSDGVSAYYICTNRNKLGITLDLDVENDRQVLIRLAREADVVLDNFRPGMLERRGINPDDLLADCDQLIWCTISGFGPEVTRPGYDFVVQAESGWMSVTGEPTGDPAKVGVALADVVAGKDAAISILAALLARNQAPTPLPLSTRRLQVSLLHSATAALMNVAQNVLVTGRGAERWGNAHANLVPYQLFRAADRHLVVAVGNDPQWMSACRALELNELGADPALATNTGRVANRERVVLAFATRLAEGDAKLWLGRLHAAGVPCGVVRSVEEALRSVDHARQSGVAPSVPGTVRLLPPRLNEHGALIRSLGWDSFRQICG